MQDQYSDTHGESDFKREVDYMLTTWITRETMETIKC